ncbi:unnamed protein product [Cladocopium goreaui]|uniref:Asparaginase n=1 Tax=Cladocopium goreaui TaxID=2562237 RepID=A0A9P1M3E2_9DINO|nr:unnamed protein product [Cladocopium goreaui]
MALAQCRALHRANARLATPKAWRLRGRRGNSAGAPLVLAVHGGAWSIPDDKKDANLSACRRAAAEGYRLLKGGGRALDAVELAVRILEDDPSLNAGRGCSLNADGNAELDAMIMEGSSLRAGAVAGVAVQHPISLSRLVMERTM